MAGTKRTLEIVLYIGALLWMTGGVSVLLDVQWAAGPYGVVVLTMTEANELTAVYGGMHLVMSALFFFAMKRSGDTELVSFAAFTCLGIALVRVYSAARWGLPESPAIYVKFAAEVLFPAVILSLAHRLKKPAG